MISLKSISLAWIWKEKVEFPHGQNLYSSKLKAKNFCFLKGKAIEQTASKTMMTINSHTQLGAMPSQLTFQQHKILCVNYRLPSKYKTKWPKPGEKDLLTMLGWKKGQPMVQGNKNNWTLNHPYSQPCVRKMFSPCLVLQPVKNHIVFIKKCSENLNFQFNKKAPQENPLCHTISPWVFEANDEVWLLTMRIWSPLLNPEL